MTDVTLQQQIHEAIIKASRILIPLPESPSGDTIAAGLALAGFLKKLNKEPFVVLNDAVPKRYRFLPDSGVVQNRLEESRGFVIVVRTDRAPLDELSYHLNEHARVVNIYLKPKEGQYEAADVSFKSDKFPYDLIVTLGVSSLDQLGRLYDDNTDLFFETPIVNIDHHTNNEHFGEINLIDITASSTAEILTELLEGLEIGLLDGAIATNLLAGILVETNSFQNTKTTPKAFLKASSLISLGANQQEIIKHLYKTKSVSLLKLWGRALARLKEVTELGLTYAVLKADDIARSGSNEIEAVMEELRGLLSDARLVMLLVEREEHEVVGYIHVHQNLPAVELASMLSGEMVNATLVRFGLSGKTIAEAESEVLTRLEKLKDKLAA